MDEALRSFGGSGELYGVSRTPGGVNCRQLYVLVDNLFNTDYDDGGYRYVRLKFSIELANRGQWYLALFIATFHILKINPILIPDGK